MCTLMNSKERYYAICASPNLDMAAEEGGGEEERVGGEGQQGPSYWRLLHRRGREWFCRRPCGRRNSTARCC